MAKLTARGCCVVAQWAKDDDRLALRSDGKLLVRRGKKGTYSVICEQVWRQHAKKFTPQDWNEYVDKHMAKGLTWHGWRRIEPQAGRYSHAHRNAEYWQRRSSEARRTGL